MGMFTPKESHTEMRRIPPEGDPTSKIMAIGEAGGRMEEISGKPFTGAAGYVLDQCLYAAGIIRAETFIHNVFPFHPPRNYIGPWFTPKGHFTPAATPYLDDLKAMIESAGANIIVAFGNTALAALTGKFGITKWRGSLLPCTLVPGKKVIPILHPAVVTYGDYISSYTIIADLKRARIESEYEELRLPYRELIIERHEAIATLEQYQKESRLAFDIETVNDQVACVSFAKSRSHAISLALSQFTPKEEVHCLKIIGKILASPFKEKILQNCLFDTGFLLQKNRMLTQGTIQDTMIAHKIMYPDFPKGLDFLCSMHAGGEPYYKDDGKQWKEKHIRDWPTFLNYSARDSVVTFHVWEEIEPDMKSGGYWDMYRDAMTYVDPLNFMVARGVATNIPALEADKKIYEDQIAEKTAHLNELCGFELNVNSPKQCMEYFYVRKRITPMTRYSKVTGESRPTIDDKALQSLAKGTLSRKPMPEASLIQEIRGDKKFLGTYLNITFDPDKRFRCSYIIMGAPTGRLASRKTLNDTGMNHQNLPLKFRRFMVADPGYVFITWDKRQAEWIVTAFDSGDAGMIYIHEHGLDAHLVSGVSISGLPEAYVKLEKEYIGESRNPHDIELARYSLGIKHPEFSRDTLAKQFPEAFFPRSFSIRQVGKHSNHGFNYDMRPPRFAEEYEVTMGEAVEIYKRYHAAYPGIQRWYKTIQEQLQDNRTLYNCYDDPRYFFGELTEEYYKDAYAHIPQGTIAKMTNRGMARMYRSRLPWMRRLELLLNGHDSLTAQQPTDNLEELALVVFEGIEALHEVFERNGREFTVYTDVKLGFNARDMIDIRMPPTIRELQRILPRILEEARDKSEDSRRPAVREADGNRTGSQDYRQS